MEFLNSDYLKNLKEKFLKNEYDDTCSGCKRLEDKGLQSIRSHFFNMYGDSTTEKLTYMELRASNLCNFECKMCDAKSSSLIAGKVFSISDEDFDEIKKLAENLKVLTLTGGEPFLIKHYYSLLDHLIEKQKTDIRLRIYTNASVYNQLFIDKILKFNSALDLSIDAVGEVAEQQRVGTKWNVVNSNIEKFLALPLPIKFHTTLTSISILGVDKLAEYFQEILQRYPNCNFTVHTAIKPAALSIINMIDSADAIASIDRAMPFLDNIKFNQFKNQLVQYRNMLINKLPT